MVLRIREAASAVLLINLTSPTLIAANRATLLSHIEIPLHAVDALVAVVPLSVRERQARQALIGPIDARLT